MAQDMENLTQSEVPFIVADTPCPTVEELMAPQVTEIKKPKLCNLDSIIPSTTVRIIREHPTTDIVKGIIMNLFGQSPPPELKTFDEIREWIETSFSKVIPPSGSLTAAGLRTPAQPTPQIMITLIEGRTEVGYCSYRRNQSRVIESPVNIEHVHECIRDGASSITGLIEMLKDRVVNDVQENRADGWWTNHSEDTSDHEPADTDDHNVMTRDGTNADLREWLDRNLTQRMRDEMGI